MGFRSRRMLTPARALMHGTLIVGLDPADWPIQLKIDNFRTLSLAPSSRRALKQEKGFTLELHNLDSGLLPRRRGLLQGESVQCVQGGDRLSSGVELKRP